MALPRFFNVAKSSLGLFGSTSSRTFSKSTKSTRNIWISDPGAYPIPIMMAGAAGMAGYFLYRIIFIKPDVTWNQANRQKHISMGTTIDEDEVARYFNHPVRKFANERFKRWAPPEHPDGSLEQLRRDNRIFWEEHGVPGALQLETGTKIQTKK